MGFDADWLFLREPADHAARDKALLAAAVEAAGPSPVILDIGCGTGSTIRAFGDRLGASARWRLVDNDPILLERASAATQNAVETVLMDIRDAEALPLDGVTLVTASALLDLVSDDWLSRLAATLKTRGIPLYAALTYDGLMRWEPEMPEDTDITQAFNRHQQQDKGFGIALGPDAHARAVEHFVGAGYETREASSPWLLGEGTERLREEFTVGVARAAGEAGADRASSWAEQRIKPSGSTMIEVGHRDLLATP